MPPTNHRRRHIDRTSFNTLNIENNLNFIPTLVQILAVNTSEAKRRYTQEHDIFYAFHFHTKCPWLQKSSVEGRTIK